MSKISLCLIVGNVEEYIVRCLDSFKPICDELCIVRAIGNQKPDLTIPLATRWAKTNLVPLQFKEYFNAPENLEWPHIDNFAAARNLSFDISTREYRFWVDSDDILSAGAEVVRELADRGGYPCYLFPYRILGQGLCLPRDRMTTKGAGRWIYPVHEMFDFAVKPAQAVQDDRVIITHLPHLNKQGGNERNLRILKSIPKVEMHTGMWYHLHLELAVAGDIPASVEAAKQALGREDLGRPEKYEIFLNLAQVADDPKIKESFLMQAYQADPCRREALGLLTVNALNLGRNETGLAFARQMMATPIPAKTEWNERTAAYGWVGDDVFAQALRANGNYHDAELVRLNALKKAGGPRIALIHATRGRYEMASATRKLWLDHAEKPELIEHVFVMDSDDKESEPLRRCHHLVVPKGGGCVEAWNHGAGSTVAPVLIQLSDDWVPFPKWDTAIIERLGNLDEPKVLAISDGHRNDDLICMVICTRKYFLLDYFMFHPWFTGVYSDNWFTELAYKRGCVIQARDIVFTHNHPLFTGQPMDKTHCEQNAPARYEQGKAVIDELRLGNDWSTVPGYFNYWSFYNFIAQRIKDGDTICEVGVWMGRSIIFMAQVLKRLGKPNVKLIAVDTFAGEANQPEHAQVVKEHGGNFRSAFEANIKRCGVADMIEIIQGESAASAAKVADGSLAFCYIDAAHDYESVKADIKAWRGKVRKGGMLGGHDADTEGVAKAVKEEAPEATAVGCVWVTGL